MRSTLSASGFVRETATGLKLKATDLGLGREFRPGKRDISRVVQKRGYRLGTRSEVLDIHSAKRLMKGTKKKGRKLRWW